MIIKGLVDEDFVNYKVPSLFIGFPQCDFKCERECGKKVCQNSEMAKAPSIDVSPTWLANRYKANPITKAVVCGGLDPFVTFDDLKVFCAAFRLVTSDPIVIYTGYKEDEIAREVEELKQFAPIVVKFGRFVPDSKTRYDEVLGVVLASENQYAKEWI